MSVTAPTIVHPLSTPAAVWPGQLNTNLAAIDNFCASVATELNATALLRLAPAAMLSWCWRT